MSYQSRPPYRPGNGMLALVLGIVGIFGPGCLTGIPAWILGRGTIQAIDRGEVNPDERSYAQAAVVLGIITTVLPLIACFVFFLVAAGTIALGTSQPAPAH